MKGKLYGVGTGPGDPELLTIKAVRIINSADVIIVPESGAERGSAALEIVQPHLSTKARIITLSFPMSPDEGVRTLQRKENARIIKELVDEGNTVVFLTLGDPLLYSTYVYILEHLASSIEIETIPGITSFCAAAAASNTPLALGNEELRIVPLHAESPIERHLAESDNVVFMKVSSANIRLADALEAASNHSCVIATKCGRDGENISRDASRLREEVPYMTTVLVKRTGASLRGGAENE